jgi:hypothetical protein
VYSDDALCLDLKGSTRTQWRMESLGPDPLYSDLHYFEMTSERAAVTSERAAEFLNLSLTNRTGDSNG